MSYACIHFHPDKAKIAGQETPSMDTMGREATEGRRLTKTECVLYFKKVHG
jgi:hypothetical protein